MLMQSMRKRLQGEVADPRVKYADVPKSRPAPQQASAGSVDPGARPAVAKH